MEDYIFYIRWVITVVFSSLVIFVINLACSKICKKCNQATNNKYYETKAVRYHKGQEELNDSEQVTIDTNNEENLHQKKPTDDKAENPNPEDDSTETKGKNKVKNINRETYSREILKTAQVSLKNKSPFKPEETTVDKEEKNDMQSNYGKQKQKPEDDSTEIEGESNVQISNENKNQMTHSTEGVKTAIGSLADATTSDKEDKNDIQSHDENQKQKPEDNSTKAEGENNVQNSHENKNQATHFTEGDKPTNASSPESNRADTEHENNNQCNDENQNQTANSKKGNFFTRQFNKGKSWVKAILPKANKANACFLPKVPKGFPNLGNTFYMNAILQNLVWTPSILCNLSKNKSNSAERALFNLVEHALNKPGDTVNKNILSDVLNAARKHNRQFCGYRQQDSFEMYNTLVGGIQVEKLHCKPKQKSNVSDLEHTMKVCPLTRLFGGVFMTVYQYKSCGHAIYKRVAWPIDSLWRIYHASLNKVELNFQMFTSICVPVPKEEKYTVDNRQKPKEEIKEIKEVMLIDLTTEEQIKENDNNKIQSEDKLHVRETALPRYKEQSENVLEKPEQLDVQPGKEKQNHRHKVNDDELIVMSENGSSWFQIMNLIPQEQKKPEILNSLTENEVQNEEKQCSKENTNATVDNRTQVIQKNKSQGNINTTVEAEGHSEDNIKDIHDLPQNGNESGENKMSLENISDNGRGSYENQDFEEKDTVLSRYNEQSKDNLDQSVSPKRVDQNGKQNVIQKQIATLPEKVTSKKIESIAQEQERTKGLNVSSPSEDQNIQWNINCQQQNIHLNGSQENEDQTLENLEIGQDLTTSGTEVQRVKEEKNHDDILKNEEQSVVKPEVRDVTGSMDESQGIEKETQNTGLPEENKDIKLNSGDQKLDQNSEELQFPSEKVEQNGKQEVNQKLDNGVTDFIFSPERKKDDVCFKLLQEANTEKPLTGIERGLNELTGIEEFDEEIFSCTECTANDPEYYAIGKTLKKLFVITPPPVLVLQINRFIQELRGLRKINKKVSFPEILNFSPYCSAAYEVTEQTPDSTNTAILYNLYGVVADSGSPSGGHYVAYVKTGRRYPEKFSEQFLKEGSFKDPKRIQKTILEFFKKENQAEKFYNQADRESVPSTGNQTEEVHNKDKSTWYYISDSWFNEINKQDVLDISNAYILFYERVQ